MSSANSVMKRKQMREKEIGHGSNSRLHRRRVEPTISPPPRPTASPQAIPQTSSPSQESYKLGIQAPKKLVQHMPDLESVQRRLRHPQAPSQDKPLVIPRRLRRLSEGQGIVKDSVIPRRLRRLSEGQGIVKDSKCRYRHSSLTETVSLQSNNRELSLEPEISERLRDNRVEAAVIDKDLFQCAERIVSTQRDEGAATSRESVPPVAHVVLKPSEERPIVDISSSSVAAEPLQSVETREASPGAHSRPLTPTECLETPGKWVKESQLQRETPTVARTPSPPAKRRATGRSKTPPIPGWWLGGRVWGLPPPPTPAG